MKTIVLLIAILLLAGPALAGDYIIGDGDQLRVSVWGVPELSVDVKVRPDGKITLPAAGDIVASGQTPPELSERIKKAVERFVKAPVVTLTVTDITNNKVYVGGDGTTPQVVNLAGKTTLFKLLCQLPGLDNADLHHAYLLRNGKKVLVDFHSLFYEGDFSKDIAFEPGDIVFIPKNEENKVYVVGAVVTPKFIPYRDGMRVLDAVLEAGGVNEFADENDVLIVRRHPEMRIHVRLKDLMKGKDMGMNLALQPGDYVTVPERLF